MSELNISQSENGGTFQVKPSDLITIRLEENPTTGYRWMVEGGHETILSFESSDLEIPRDPKFGQGGMRIIKFRAKAPGKALIRLKHWCEWKGEESVTERFRVTIRAGN